MKRHFPLVIALFLAGPVPQNKFPVPGTYQIMVQGQGIILRSSLEIR
jgi:hypothetical protein